MTDWTPTLFEEEMLAIQPDGEFVHEYYSPGTLINIPRNNIFQNDDIDSYENINLDESEGSERIERETINMMRNFGIESSLEGQLDSKRTLPTPRSKKGIIYEGKMPILLDEAYFQLKPKTEVSTSTSTSTSNDDDDNESNETAQSFNYKLLNNSSESSLASSFSSMKLSSTSSSNAELSIPTTSISNKENNLIPPLDKILGIDRYKSPMVRKKVENTYFNEFPELPIHIQNHNYQKPIKRKDASYYKMNKKAV